MDKNKEIKRLKTKRKLIIIITTVFVIIKILDSIITKGHENTLYLAFAVIVIICNFLNLKVVNKKIAQLESE